MHRLRELPTFGRRRNLLLITSPTAEYDELLAAQDELSRRLSEYLQNDKLKEVLKAVTARPAMSGLLWRAGVETLLKAVETDMRSLEPNDFSRGHPFLVLLLDFVSTVPELVSPTGARADPDADPDADPRGCGR